MVGEAGHSALTSLKFYYCLKVRNEISTISEVNQNGRFGMSRDIKFRAWNLVAIPKRMMSHKDICFYKDLKMYELFCDTPDNRPWIIMLWTGLHDKNGKEIYEGDIIDEKYKFEVFFQNGSFLCRSKEDLSRTRTLEQVLNTRRRAECPSEVIGNIYENADLLK